jgi:L-alanine-DL-glutamate epimerase-like enolase superfamily enzyme
MKIRRVETWREGIPLLRPYQIATAHHAEVDLVFVRLETDTGLVGIGSGSPAEHVTGETIEACETALDGEGLAWLDGRDARDLGALRREARSRLRPTPAARAAVDMALYDLFARILDRPLVDVLGRCHDALPTSITVGIQSADDARAEVLEYLGRGFRCLKVKIGLDFEADLERLSVVRETAGPSVAIRVDANQGYDLQEARALAAVLDDLDIEFAEQPLQADALEQSRSLPASLRHRIAMDESVQVVAQAFDLVREPKPGGIFNIKLMKCGGITPALDIARLAELGRIDVMWGCMDESCISIAAALHTAYACPATRYLDLDGSLDLARDPGRGGFLVREGNLVLDTGPGLGVELLR